MKIRKTFVTNSSSASFVIVKKLVSPDQRMRFDKVIDFMIKQNGDATDWWDIDEDERFITGFTIMDNSWLAESLEQEGFDMNLISIEGD